MGMWMDGVLKEPYGVGPSLVESNKRASIIRVGWMMMMMMMMDDAERERECEGQEPD